MCSRIERPAIAAWLLLWALGCPGSAPPVLIDAPGLTVAAPVPLPEDASTAPGPDAGAGPRVETLDALVFEFAGKAEVRRGGTGDWVALSVGDAVRVSDEVRTSADGNLEMRFGDARIQVREGSELTLKFLEPRAIRAEVRGLASGETPDGGELTFEGSGGVRAVSRGGQLTLDANDRRALASSASGGVQLTVGDETVVVPAGQQAIAQGTAISRPGKIPKKVALKVGWPAQAETNQAELVVKGRVSASARVLVMGLRVEPNADGTFETRVRLERGAQVIRVLAIDPLGRRASDKRKITFDPSAPTVRGKVEYR